MQVVNAVMPSPAQLQSLVGAAAPGPIVMLNLLKFRENAAYDDGQEQPIGGREAYMRYGVEMQKIVVAGGGRILFSGRAQALAIGVVEEMWDMVALVEYPSAAGFVQIATSPDVGKIAHHRKAGLAGQLLIMCSPEATPV